MGTGEAEVGTRNQEKFASLFALIFWLLFQKKYYYKTTIKNTFTLDPKLRPLIFPHLSNVLSTTSWIPLSFGCGFPEAKEPYHRRATVRPHTLVGVDALMVAPPAPKGPLFLKKKVWALFSGCPGLLVGVSKVRASMAANWAS